MVFVCTRCKREVDTPGQFCPFCGTPAPPPAQERSDPLVGRTIAAKYFVNQRLGSGGMGQVYKATDVILDRPVALKMLNRSLLADASMVQRFHREARAASRLNHANCITILDFGQTDDESLFIAMEFLAGRALSKVISDEAPIPQGRAVRIVAQVLAALAEAHGNGVIHRDLKPSNVMLETRREEPDFVKVLDFGIAKLSGAGEAGSQLTGTGIVCGTPGYMSPEQARGEDLDARSDLYAVGVILYELLTGRLPFDSETPMGYVTKHLMEAPIPMRERRPDLDIAPELEAVAMRALAKERDARPASAEAFRDELLAARIDKDAPRPAPGPAAPSTLFIPALGDRTPGTPAPSPRPARGDVPSAVSPAAGEGARPPTPSHARPRTPFPATPSPARPATPSPARVATPYPARPATPSPARPATPAPSAAGDREVPATPRPSRPARPAPRAGRGRTPMIAGGAAVVIAIVAYALLRPDPFSQPAPKGGAEADSTLTLAAPGGPPPAPKPAAPRPDAAPVAPQPSAAPQPVATPQPAPAPQAPPAPPPVVVAAPRPTAPAPVVAPPPPRPGPHPVAAKARKGSGVIEAAEGVKVLAVPAVATGQGLLAVTASPWGVVAIDGKEIGETPREVRVGEGYYKVKVAHPTLGVRETSITVPAGRRAAYNVTFSR